MKTGIFLAGLVQLAAAQPHRHQHQHAHQKRDDVYVTDVTYVTQQAPDVVVYVDSNGNPVSTSTENVVAPTVTAAAVHTEPAAAAPTSTAAAESSEYVAPALPASSAAAYVAPAVSAAAAVVNPIAAVVKNPVKSSAAAVPSTSASTSSSSSNDGMSITYSPYTANGDCKTQDQVNTDFDQLDGYSMVRIYGTDCDQVNTVGTAAKAKNMKLFAGIFDINDISGETQTIISTCNGDFSHIDTISVGNELVNSGQASASAVVSALASARSIMNAAGYTGNMVTVDTFSAIIANPVLCQSSDYAAANAHAFFDSSILAAGAGVWAKATQVAVQAACGGKKTVITESGWPSSGQCNGVACPTEANQQAAISSLRTAFASGNIFLFNSYNDLWKSNWDGSFDAEQAWGIYGTSTSG